MLRIIDNQTKIFLRDDFTFDEENEIALEVNPSQGLYIPKWDNDKWVEGATQEYIDNLKAQATQQEPTESEVLADLIQLLIDKEVIL